jgi:hypothetical protein
MNDTFHRQHDELITYLYDECEPAERDAITAHLAQCASCAEEVEALRATRGALAAWVPPDAALGFQIAPGEAPQPASVLPFAAREARREQSWWRRPLPAWAQVAAAALIFAAGLAAGSSTTREAAQVASAPAVEQTLPASPVLPVTVATVTADDFKRLEQRLAAMERGQTRPAFSPAAPSLDESALLARVQAVVQAGEERQQRENAMLQANIATLADYVRGFDAQRRADLRLFEDRLGRIQGATGAELQQQRDALSYFVRASLTGGAGR